jgi:hypothetical protein
MKRRLSVRLKRSVGIAALLAVAVQAPTKTVRADDSMTSCNAAAGYLREFTARHGDDATSEYQFPFNALSSGSEGKAIAFVGSSEGVERLDDIAKMISPLTIGPALRDYLAAEHLSDSETSYWYLRDARAFGNLIAIYQIGGTAHCEEGMLFDTSTRTLEPLYPHNYGQEETCDGFGGGFDLLKIEDKAFPAVTSIADQSGQFKSSIAVLPRSKISSKYPVPLCHISVNFKKFEDTIGWHLSENQDERALSEQLKSALVPLMPKIRSGAEISVLLSNYLASAPNEVPGDTFDDIARFNQPNEQMKQGELGQEYRRIASQFSDGGWILYGPYWAMNFNGAKIIIASGEYEMGWRMTGYSSLAAWRWTGREAIPLLSADFLVKASEPEIVVSDQ